MIVIAPAAAEVAFGWRQQPQLCPEGCIEGASYTALRLGKTMKVTNGDAMPTSGTVRPEAK
jgi:hypothetical protein